MQWPFWLDHSVYRDFLIYMFSSENLKYILEDNIDKVLLKSGRFSVRSLASVAYFQAQHLDTLFSHFSLGLLQMLQTLQVIT